MENGEWRMDTNDEVTQGTTGVPPMRGRAVFCRWIRLGGFTLPELLVNLGLKVMCYGSFESNLNFKWATTNEHE
jgi:hypothetical protein